MAAKKKNKSKAMPQPKRPATKPKQKAKPAPKTAAKRVQPQAKRVAGPKPAKPRAGVAKPLLAAKPVESPKHSVVTPPSAASPTLVRPGLQKRADLMPIGIVRVTDGYQLIEESTFYSAPGRDEYVQRWTARGYTCRFMPTNN